MPPDRTFVCRARVFSETVRQVYRSVLSAPISGLAKVSRGLGEAMVGINVDEIPQPHRLAERGW